MQLKGLWKLGVLVLLLLILLCGERDGVVASKNELSPEKQPEEPWHPLEHRNHSLDVFLSGKRRVPNASDPLHNR
ncbi:hypothetical protein NMG60_11031209 [Bertholletia excelsa]